MFRGAHCQGPLAQGFAGKQKLSYPAAQILLAATGPTFLLLERSLVRAYPFSYFLATAGLACAIVMLWNRRAAMTALAGAFVGATLVGFQQGGVLDNYLRNIGDTPTRTLNAAAYLARADEQDSLRAAVSSPKRFKAWPESKLAARLRALAAPRKPTFWVLSDAQILYLLLDQKPPYHLNLYDASPITEQRRMIELVDERQPEYMVWYRELVDVDAVPYTVRDPLVFNFAIGHYVPLQLGRRQCPAGVVDCGRADVLRKRRPGERIPVRYWRARLGTSIELGYIPSYADPPETPCSGDDCAPYAVVHGSAPKGTKIALSLSGNGMKYSAVFTARDGVSDYTIRLDRLWFWRLLGPNPRVSAATPGWTLRTVEGKSDDRLY